MCSFSLFDYVESLIGIDNADKYIVKLPTSSNGFLGDKKKHEDMFRSLGNNYENPRISSQPSYGIRIHSLHHSPALFSLFDGSKGNILVNF